MIEVTPAFGSPAGGNGSTEHGGRSIADPVLTTKLFAPRLRRELVPRPQLIDRLSAALEGILTLVVAPAGWGKTTLLGAWSDACEAPMAWLSLDAGDNDLRRFLRSLIAALRTLEPGVGESALRYLQSPGPPPVEALLTVLINDLTSLSGDIVLVLDDYQAIDDPGIHRSLSFLLDRLPPRLHVVIATRTDPPLPLARLRARGRLTELRAADLRFTRVETAGLLNDAMSLQLSEEDIAILDACTEGWIAGLQLAALFLRDRVPNERHAFIATSRGANRYILDYLADEVFDAQPEEIRRFLLRTSVLDRLSGPLCDALVGVPGNTSDGQTMLERLDDGNLFLVPLDGDRMWYRYHHLFAAFLRKRLERTDPDLVPELHRRAGEWLAAHGMQEVAVDHALAAGEHERAAQLIEGVTGGIIWERGELATVFHWQEKLPREVLVAHPRLNLDLAWACLWSARVDAIEPRLQDVESTLTVRSDTRTDDSHCAIRGEVAAIRAELARQRGEIESAIALARAALADLPDHDRVVRGATTGLLAGAYLWSGDVAAASRGYAETITLGDAPDAMLLGLIAGGRLVLVQALQGRLSEAEGTYRETLQRASTRGIPSTPAIGVAQIGMAEVLRERNDLAAAEALVRQGIAGCTSWAGLAEMALDGYLTLARILSARREPDGALAALGDAQAVGREHRVPRVAERVGLARARVQLDAGDVAGAVASLRRAAGGAPGDGHAGYFGLLEGIMLARVKLARSDVAAATVLLPKLLGSAEAGGFTGCAIEILVLQAVTFHRAGQAAEASIALARALSLGEQEGYVRPFADEGPILAPLLRALASRGRSGEYIDTLLLACGPRPEVGVQELVEPLSARELELLRSLAAGLSTPEIARQLFITPGTVRNHLKSIFGKLDVHSRLQAVERARALRLV